MNRLYQKEFLGISCLHGEFIAVSLIFTLAELDLRNWLRMFEALRLIFGKTTDFNIFNQYFCSLFLITAIAVFSNCCLYHVYWSKKRLFASNRRFSQLSQSISVYYLTKDYCARILALASVHKTFRLYHLSHGIKAAQ